MRFTQTILFIFLFANLFAQHLVNDNLRTRQSFANIQVQSPLSSKDYLNNVKSEMGLRSKDEFVLQKTTQQENNVHRRYRQYHEGIEVIGATYIIHERDGKAVKANGNFLPNIEIKTTPTITSKNAIDIALARMDAEMYDWEYFINEENVDWRKPKAELKIIDSKFPDKSNDYLLVYEIELYSIQPLSKTKYYINAHTGKIEKEFPHIHMTNVPAQGTTHYYGLKEFIVDSIQENFVLLSDKTRGKGIHTYKRDFWQYQIANNSNNWNFPEYSDEAIALDIHWGASRFYDLLLEHFNWNGLDNEGMALNGVAHSREIFANNAYWDGTYANFGDGDCYRDPLTSLDVVGHEFTHGITEFTANLIYSDESGALNEAMSDIFGKVHEYFYDTENFNWLVGDKCSQHPNVEPFRSMKDPNVYYDPKFYRGEFWVDGGGVHSNSGVLNYWFYLLTDGGVGTNENGVNFNVEGLGMEKSMQIPFLMLTSYMIESTNYREAYDLSLLAVQELYGQNSEEELSVKEAWKAVGIPFDNNQQAIYDMKLTIEDGFYTCLNENFHTIQLSVENTGTVPIPEGTDLEIFIDFQADNAINHTLTNALLPGEVINLEKDDYLFVDQDNYYYIGASLENFDANQTNNIFYSEILNFTSEEKDLRIRLESITRVCGSDEIALEFVIKNVSCSEINVGESYSIEIKSNGDLLALENYTTTKPLTIAEGILVTDVQMIRDQIVVTTPNEEISIKLIWNGDTNLLNNTRTYTLPNDGILNKTYVNDFEDEADLLELDLFHEFYEPVEYNGQNMLGFLSTQDDELLICEPHEEYFRTANLPGFRFCIDLSNLSDPTMHFDLAQFRSNIQSIDPSQWPFTALTKVSWYCEQENGEQLISGLQEGVITNQSIELPSQFVGEIKFTFFSFFGDSEDLMSNNFENGDFNLIDNISFDGTTSTVNPELDDFIIYPNPARDEIQVMTQNDGKSEFEIFDITGKKRMQGALSNMKTIQIRNLNSGVYYLKLKSEEHEEWSSQMFVVQE